MLDFDTWDQAGFSLQSGVHGLTHFAGKLLVPCEFLQRQPFCRSNLVPKFFDAASFHLSGRACHPLADPGFYESVAVAGLDAPQGFLVQWEVRSGLCREKAGHAQIMRLQGR